AVPAAGEVARQVGLHVVHGVEDDHALLLRHRVVLEAARLAVAPEDAEHGVHQASPSTTRRSSSGRGGIGSCATVIRSPWRRTITLTVPKCLSESGYSTRVWAPRLSRGSPWNARAYCAAYVPARRPKTSRSESELPPRRLAPWSPPPTSPAAKRPGTVAACDSGSTRTPPIT